MIQRLRFDKYSALYLWALFMIVFTITEGTTFLSWTSAKLVFTDPAVFTGTLALAFLVPLATGTYDLAIGAQMSMALVVSATLASNDTTPDIVGDVHRPRRLRDRRVRLRLLRRQAEGEQLHRHARHEPGDHRGHPLDVGPVDQRPLHRQLPRHRSQRSCSGCRCTGTS